MKNIIFTFDEREVAMLGRILSMQLTEAIANNNVKQTKHLLSLITKMQDQELAQR